MLETRNGGCRLAGTDTKAGRKWLHWLANCPIKSKNMLARLPKKKGKAINLSNPYHQL